MIMKSKGLTNFSCLRIKDMGFKKGKTAISDETITAIYERASIID